MSQNDMQNQIESVFLTSKPSGLPRMAFSLKEVAEMLGLSYPTVFRFVQRGKLRSCGGIRHKLITKAELERFLKSTTEGN